MMFKSKKEMSEPEKKAKLAALKGAHDMATEAMKEGLHGAKKVMISADSKEGLQKGLDTVEKLLGQKDMDDQVESDKMYDSQEGYEDQQESSEPMDEDEINAEIERLMKLKEKLQAE